MAPAAGWVDRPASRRYVQGDAQPDFALDSVRGPVPISCAAEV
jgi:hypothetical protein